MARLGPFEPAPVLAVGVSGGADSTALALLADHWARERDGRAVALVVDHRLRAHSSAEAAQTRACLAGRGIDSELLVLTGLSPGPAMEEKARRARHAALRAAAWRRGILHLLLAHHAGDQVETVAMRRLSGSGPAGLAGMAGLFETADVRVLRPLLGVAPGRLRATLRAEGMVWIEDPSNADPALLRARLRAARGDSAGQGIVVRAAVAAAAARGRARAEAERAAAGELAARVRLSPWGYAVLSPGPIGAESLVALLRMLAGAAYPPVPVRVAALAADPHPATLGGVRLLPAGKLGAGWLLVREQAAIAPPVAARIGALWDGRFRLAGAGSLPGGLALGALGAAAAAVRGEERARGVPAVVLATLPALWRAREMVAVPQLCLYRDTELEQRVTLDFVPPVPMAGAPFAVI